MGEDDTKKPPPCTPPRRLQHKLLLYRLMPRTLVHKLKAHASMPVEGKPRNRQGAGDVFEGGTTPAEVMLQVLANCLEGQLPDGERRAGGR